MKKVWITSLIGDKQMVQKVMASFTQYGIEGNGHFWVDDLKNIAWLYAKEQIVDKDTALWIVLCSKENLAKESVRFGLSLLTISVQAEKGHGFPILIVDPEEGLTSEMLSTPLKGADIVSLNSPTLGAKIVAKANTPIQDIETEYKIDVHSLPGFTWFEIIPLKGIWNGALMGVQGAEIDFQGVGKSGILPQKTVLEYPVKGMKIKLGETEYTAWAVQNKIGKSISYYVRVQGIPKSILFGPFQTKNEAEVHVMKF